MEFVLLLDVTVVVMEALVLVVQSRPDDPSNIPSLSAVESLQAPQRVCAKDEAFENIPFMLTTLDTSHLEMSTLNNTAAANVSSRSIALDTSHLETSPLNNDAE